MNRACDSNKTKRAPKRGALRLRIKNSPQIPKRIERYIERGSRRRSTIKHERADSMRVLAPRKIGTCTLYASASWPAATCPIAFCDPSIADCKSSDESSIAFCKAAGGRHRKGRKEREGMGRYGRVRLANLHPRGSWRITEAVALDFSRLCVSLLEATR